MDLSDELHESQHRAVGDASVSQAAGSPGKGQKITHGKAEIHQPRGPGRIFCSFQDALMPRLLLFFQRTEERCGVCNGFDHEDAGERFLDDRPNGAVVGAGSVAQSSHGACIRLGREREEGNQKDDDDGERVVHEKEQAERSDELSDCGEDCGHGFSRETHHVCHVSFQSVGQCCGVVAFERDPLTAEQSLKEFSSHVVLRFDAQDGSNPSASQGDGNSQHHEEGNQCQCGMQVGGGIVGRRGQGSDVHRAFCRPNECQVQTHEQQSRSGVQDSLQAIPFELSEQESHGWGEQNGWSKLKFHFGVFRRLPT